MNNKTKTIVIASTLSTIILTGCSEKDIGSSIKSLAPSKSVRDLPIKNTKVNAYQIIPMDEMNDSFDKSDKIRLDNGSSVQASLSKSYTNSINGTVSINPPVSYLKDDVARDLNSHNPTYNYQIALPQNTTLIPYSIVFTDHYTDPTTVINGPQSNDEAITKIYLVTKHHTVDLSKSKSNGAVVIPIDGATSAKFKIVNNKKTTYVNLLGKITNQ